ncbi:MAG: DUF805 domain-containing protein [Deltaproteobacteria bacterium]|jgi:uncharacterized membrane protein YhaH (DUF805 family)|nr:DUF805 domain-containing protein [Deltaproteobacteria bacterium]
MTSYAYSWRNAFNFNGRASRKEFWIFILINVILFLALSFLIGFVAGLTGAVDEYNIDKLNLPITILQCIIGICSLGIMVRRIHDFGKSGWFILLTIIPFVGLIFGLIPSEPYPNNYGNPPSDNYGSPPPSNYGSPPYNNY